MLTSNAPGALPLLALFWAMLYSATPLVLAAMGGVLSERAGVVNIALEGFILFGAFVGFWAGQGSGWIGLLAVVGVGAMLGLLHAFLTQKTRMNHVVSGLGINLLASGLTRYLFVRHFGANTPTISGLPESFFLAIALVAPFAVFALLNQTRFGLRLRAVGENPESARLAGIAPIPIRAAAVTLSGIFAALAGAYLSMGVSKGFTSEMSAGKGYIALAAVILGKWNPLWAALGALGFGLVYALQIQLQISNFHLTPFGIELSSPFLLDALPYVVTLIALVSVVGRATPPAALGQEEA